MLPEVACTRISLKHTHIEAKQYLISFAILTTSRWFTEPRLTLAVGLPYCTPNDAETTLASPELQFHVNLAQSSGMLPQTMLDCYSQTATGQSYPKRASKNTHCAPVTVLVGAFLVCRRSFKLQAIQGLVRLSALEVNQITCVTAGPREIFSSSNLLHAGTPNMLIIAAG